MASKKKTVETLADETQRDAMCDWLHETIGEYEQAVRRCFGADD